VISRIVISNFKNIGDISLDLSPTINSFIGSNGSGKSSAIWKSTKLVLRNENWAFTKVKRGASKSTITIESPTFSIQRSRSKSTSTVILNGTEYLKKTDLESNFKALGFYDYTISGKPYNFHFLKASDIFEYLPRSSEGLYLKLAGVFSYSRISQSRKDCKKHLAKYKGESEVLGTTINENKDLKVTKLDKLSNLLSRKHRLINYIEKLKLANTCKDSLSKIQDLINLKDFLKSELQQRDEYIKLQLISELKTSIKELIYLRHRINLLKLQRSSASIDNITQKITQLIDKKDDLVAIQTTYWELEKLIPRCETCGRPLDS